MFESGIKAKDLIEELKDEIDVALPIPDSYYVSWLNSVEQLLYSEIITEQRIAEISNPTVQILLSEISYPERDETEEDSFRFSDIYTIYADGVQLTKINKATNHIFNDVFYESGKYLEIKTTKEPIETIRIIYFTRPIPKEIDSPKTVKVPLEFIDLIRSKIRGEAYKFVNEDVLASKWLNDYNVLLETFKAWVSARESRFGM